MARKASANSESSRGFNDIIGVVLMCFAALLLAALLSYHPRDVSANAVPPNASVRNWIGPFGAWLAYYWFFWVGAAAYLLPVCCSSVGLGCFFDAFAYLRRRWAWALVLVFCCMGLLDLYRDYFGKLQRNLNADVGGILGRNLNQHFFGECFGTAGATIIFLMLYFISLLFLTNFQLGEWIRAIWGRRAAAEGEPADGGGSARTAGARPAKAGEEAAGGSRALRPGRGHEARPRADRPRPQRAAAQQIRAGQEAGPARAGQGACARG